MSRPVALLDANVLYPARLRDLLIRLAIAGLYQARWSEQILDECFDNLLENRPDLTHEQLARTRQLMTTALPDASATGYEDRVADLDLPDPDDRHVLAAAVTAGASLLVTDNLDDFPAEQVPEGMSVVSPDEFVLEMASDDLDVVVDVVDTQAAGLVNPPMTARVLDDGSEKVLDGSFTLGRHPGCDVPLADPSASRHHAEIRPAVGGWLLIDLGSTNGTSANSQPTVHRLLGDGDIIEIGFHRITYHSTADTPSTDPGPASTST